MGTSIHGFVECRTWVPGLDVDQRAWNPAIRLSMLGMTRDYEAFDCLFGVRSDGRWNPIAADRGLPPDVSATTRAELGETDFGASWIGWDEVTAIDWDEPALPRATDIAQYRRLPDGTLDLVHRAVWSRGFARASGIDTQTVDPDRIGELWAEGTEWQAGNTVYRAERARRRDAIPTDGPWHPVWTVMRTLAEVHGATEVRLVVWFDD
ncbi:hypothetical protein [Actinoplanes subglobosus]|uniref:Uncharacterized protein n=1 Tax=Actinoplanes subglobosus TaxID=1547892 RepID=A0ABV8IN67_9ACTN